MLLPPRLAAAAFAAFTISALTARAARAWATVEHQALGEAAYQAACAEITEAVRPRVGDPAIAGRLAYVCGANTAVSATLYGAAIAIAGDFVGAPSELLGHFGWWRFSSRTHYYRLALRNSEHFNPLAPRAWSTHHQNAIRHAQRGAAAQGLASLEQLEIAVQESAFADHFLQDLFAAGHMGFNRTASSAAASKSFHDHWNERGRVVASRDGGRWLTFGDGRLDAPANAESRRRVLAASTASLRGVLLAFVTGEPAAAADLAIWASFPFTIEAPEITVDSVELFKRGEYETMRLVPLLGSVRPARKDTVGDVTTWMASSFDGDAETLGATVAAAELAVPFMPLQTRLGVGVLWQADATGRGAVADTGVVIPLGLSVDGLVSHEVGLTVSWLFPHEFDDVGALGHAEYRLNIELGEALLSLRGGLAGMLPADWLGWYAGAALGYTFSAAGGGAL